MIATGLWRAPNLAMLLTLALAGWANSAAAFEDLRLRPRWDDPALRDDALEMSPRLARIDAIEDSLLQHPESTNDSLVTELVRLYRGSPLMKHRVMALQWSDRLPSQARLRERAFTFRRTFNPWDARESLEDWMILDPESGEAQRWRGLHDLEEVFRDPERLDDARTSFETAVRSVDAGLDDWLGLAAIAVFQEDYPALFELVDPLLARAGPEPGPHLLAAVAYEAMGMPSLASREFSRAFERMSPTLRERFEYPHAFLIRQNHELYGPSLVERPEPPPVRGWWVRMVEAEVMFSDPDRGVHAWDTAPGQAYLLFGRPVAMRVYDSESSITAGGPFARHADQVRRQIWSMGRIYGSQYWAWLIRSRSGREYPLIFMALTPFGKWLPNPKGEVEILEAQKKQGPVRLAESLPEPVVPEGMDVAVRSVGFPNGRGEMRIESWVAIRGTAPSASMRVRMRLLDEEGREIDRVERPLDARRSRRWLRSRVRGYPRGAEGWLHGFGALVPPGRYTSLVEVLDPDGKVVAGRDELLRYDPADHAAGDFGMSELVLCDAFLENAPLEGIPPEGVRHARVVLVHPETSLHPGQDFIDLYFEVYGATADATGLTHIETEYEVYPKDGYDPYVRGGAIVDGELVPPLLRAHFPNERTGRTPGGAVIKGTRLDLRDAPAGEYVVLTRVGDRLARREATAILEFRVPEREQTEDPDTP